MVKIFYSKTQKNAMIYKNTVYVSKKEVCNPLLFMQYVSSSVRTLVIYLKARAGSNYAFEILSYNSSSNKQCDKH